MLEVVLAMVDGDVSFKRFVDSYVCSGEAEALCLGRDVEAAAVPLHDIVVADRAFVMKTADAIQFGGGGTPGLFRLAWRTT